MDISDLQRELVNHGYTPGPIDGVWGPRTLGACLEFLEENWVVGPAQVVGWSEGRVRVAAAQLIMHYKGIDVGPIDGYLGAMTRRALRVYEGKVDHLDRPEPSEDSVSGDRWPTEKNVLPFFGPVGRNQVRMQLPYTMRLAWDPSTIINSISLHEKVAPSASRVLSKVYAYYGDRIPELRLDLFGGSLNVRRKVNGTSWSMHAWGIAIDIDPEHNALRWDHSRASLALPEYNKWWEFWEEEGWFSLGRTKDFDWMHVQAARP